MELKLPGRVSRMLLCTKARSSAFQLIHGCRPLLPGMCSNTFQISILRWKQSIRTFLRAVFSLALCPFTILFLDRSHGCLIAIQPTCGNFHAVIGSLDCVAMASKSLIGAASF